MRHMKMRDMKLREMKIRNKYCNFGIVDRERSARMQVGVDS